MQVLVLNSSILSRNELEEVKCWAHYNNLKLNLSKTKKKRAPKTTTSGHGDSLKILGVIISGNFSVKVHINEVLTKCMSRPCVMAAYCLGNTVLQVKLYALFARRLPSTGTLTLHRHGGGLL